MDLSKFATLQVFTLETAAKLWCEAETITPESRVCIQAWFDQLVTAASRGELPVDKAQQLASRNMLTGEVRYHLNEAVRIQRLADGGPVQDALIVLGQWMVERTMEAITTRDLTHNAPRSCRARTAKEAEGLLEEMEALAWIRPTPPPAGGRKPVWLVNPKLGTVLARRTAWVA